MFLAVKSCIRLRWFHSASTGLSPIVRAHRGLYLGHTYYIRGVLLTKDSRNIFRLGTPLAVFIFLGLLPAFAGVAVSSPANGATVSSPVHVVASATSSSQSPITTTRIYLDNVRAYQVQTSRVNTYLTMNPGQHNVTVQSWDAYR